MQFISVPRYLHDEEKRFEALEKIKEDVGMTFRKQCPQEHEIRPLRKKNFS